MLSQPARQILRSISAGSVLSTMLIIGLGLGAAEHRHAHLHHSHFNGVASEAGDQVVTDSDCHGDGHHDHAAHADSHSPVSEQPSPAEPAPTHSSSDCSICLALHFAAAGYSPTTAVLPLLVPQAGHGFEPVQTAIVSTLLRSARIDRGPPA